MKAKVAKVLDVRTGGAPTVADMKAAIDAGAAHEEAEAVNGGTTCNYSTRDDMKTQRQGTPFSKLISQRELEFLCFVVYNKFSLAFLYSSCLIRRDRPDHVSPAPEWSRECWAATISTAAQSPAQ